jgi:hypothetical protein
MVTRDSLRELTLGTARGGDPAGPEDGVVHLDVELI